MPDDQNTTQNPTPEENSIPPSPQEPTEPAPENTAHSEPSVAPPEASEVPRNSESAIPVNNDNSPQNESEAISPEPETSPETPENQGSSSSKPQTAQIPVNEPLVKVSLARELLVKARNMIQFRKRKKLDRIMTLFLSKSKITNDEVEKFLHISDATVTRYLSQLEKEEKIKQSGETGKGVSYIKI